jgi:hypothetical protein
MYGVTLLGAVFEINYIINVDYCSIPELFTNLKYSSDEDKAKTKTQVEQFQQQFLQAFQVLVTVSL